MKKRVGTILTYVLLLSVVAGAAVFLVKRGLPKNALVSDVSISGTITRDGKPLEWDSDVKNLWVIFSEKADGTTLDVMFKRAETDGEKGTYRIDKIPPGEYQVCIMQMGEDSRFDQLNFAYNPANSRLYRTVDKDGQIIDIDLPRELPKTSRPAMPAKKDE